MVEFDATILIQAINFLVLLAILNQIFFKPILRIQSERQEAVDGARVVRREPHAGVKIHARRLSSETGCSPSGSL